MGIREKNYTSGREEGENLAKGGKTIIGRGEGGWGFEKKKEETLVWEGKTQKKGGPGNCWGGRVLRGRRWSCISEDKKKREKEKGGKKEIISTEKKKQGCQSEKKSEVTEISDGRSKKRKELPQNEPNRTTTRIGRQHREGKKGRRKPERKKELDKRNWFPGNSALNQGKWTGKRWRAIAEKGRRQRGEEGNKWGRESPLLTNSIS